MKFILTILILFLSHTLHAQEAGSEGASNYKGQNVLGLQTGPLLPSGIDGVTEIIMLSGVRFGLASDNSHWDFEFNYGSTGGMSLLNGSASLRGNFEFEDLYMIAGLGLDVSRYNSPTTDSSMEFGGHFTTGLLANISNTTWFRTELRLMVNPGVSLYIAFGLEFTLGGGEGGDQN